MFKIFGKKRIKDDKAANIFVNTIFETVDEGFPVVADLINNSPEFVKSPNINPNDSDAFLMIVIAGNLALIPNYLHDYQEENFTRKTIEKFSKVFNVSEQRFLAVVKDYQSFMKKVNYPSKNTLYAMSKAVFFKYNLFEFEDDYFKNMKTPNPLFLKRLDEAMDGFIWNWEAFLDKYHIV